MVLEIVTFLCQPHVPDCLRLKPAPHLLAFSLFPRCQRGFQPADNLSGTAPTGFCPILKVVSALELSRLFCPKWSFEAFGGSLHRGIGAECRAECRAEPVAPGPKAPGPSPGRPLGRWAGAGRRPRRAPRAPGPEPPRQRLRGRRGRGGESEPGAMAGGVGGGGACESCPPVAALLFLASGI